MSNLVAIENSQVVTASRQIAECFEKRHDHVIRDIENIKKDVPNFGEMFFESTLPDSYGRDQKVYLMNRDGFTLLAMGFTGAKALDWKLKYIQAFNEMESQLKQPTPMTQLEILAQTCQALVDQEKQLKQIAATQEQQAAEIKGIRDVVALNPNDWRKDTTTLINKMALSMGGYEHVKPLRSESYKLLDERFGVDLQCRLTNKRRRMADEGVCKSKRDKLNQLDVIGDDKKLIEGYVAIIKEMAIKYGCKTA